MNPAEEITESNGSSSSSSSSSASSNNNTSISNDSSNPSTDVNNDINNEVNDSNDNDIRFEEDAALKDFFSSDSKITALPARHEAGADSTICRRFEQNL